MGCKYVPEELKRAARKELGAASEADLKKLEDDVKSGGQGLSDDEKTLLMNILSSAVYTNDDVGTAMEQLENLFSGNPAIEYSVTYNLTDVTADNDATTAKAGFPYTATITVADGFELNTASFSVVMGGEDISESVYSDGFISIPVVTGEIVITAETREKGLVYDSGGAIVFNADRGSIKTGFDMFGEDKAFTLYVDGKTSQWNTKLILVSFASNPDGNYGGGLYRHQGGDGSWRWNAHYSLDQVQIPLSTSIKLAVVKKKGSNTATVYSLTNNQMNTYSWNTSRYKGNASNVYIGSSSLVGTINLCKIYEKALDESTIKTMMGVE